MTARPSSSVIIFGTVLILALLYFFPGTTHAVFNKADLKCVPGKDYTCPCGTPAEECPQKMPGGLNCPCPDETNGHVTPGICLQTLKCLGQPEGGMGMPPMLPMLPMMMPMMDMPQDPCMQPGAGVRKDGTASTSSSTPQTSPCNSGTGGYDFGSSIFDTSSYFNDTGSSGDASSGLIDSLNGNGGGVSQVINTATQTVSQTAPATPTTTGGLTGVIRVGNAGATIVANLRQGLTEFAGFFGGNALTIQASQSIAGRLCAIRPWAGTGVLANIMPDNFFDSLCKAGGYQVGVVTPQPGTGGGSVIRVNTSRATGATSTRPRTDLGPASVDIWAEPASVRLGSRTYIFWNSKGVLECKATGPNFFQNSLSGGASTVPISGPTTYSIECTAPDNTKVTDTVTVTLAL